MKQFLLFLAFLFALSGLSQAQSTGMVTVQGSNVHDASNATITNATITFAPVDTHGQPLSFRRGGATTGQIVTNPITAQVSNGGFSVSLPDTNLTYPQNVCFNVTVVDNTDNNQLFAGGYSCVQPVYDNSTSSNPWCVAGFCNFDNYLPTGIPLLPPNVAPSIGLGTVTTLAPGSQASASMSAAPTGNGTQYTLNLGIPTGAVGCVLGSSCVGVLALSGGTMTGPITNMTPLGPGSYTFYVQSGTVYARNNNTQNVDYSGTDAAVVINDVLTSLAQVGGHLYFQNGVYSLNSVTAETVSPYNPGGANPIYCAICIPASNAVNYPSFVFEGESAAIGSQVHPAAKGVVFQTTAAARAAAGSSSNNIAAIWMRPTTACDTEYPASGCLYWNDHVEFKNLAVNVPDDTRCHEYGINTLEASHTTLDHVQIGFTGGPYTTPTTCTTLTAFEGNSTASDGTFVKDTQLDPGWYVGYGINSEHSVLIDTETFADTYCYVYGHAVSRSGSSIFHGSQFIHIEVYDCIYGVTVGPHVNTGAQLDIIGLDDQYGTTGAFAQVYAMSGGNAGGFISWANSSDQGVEAALSTPFTTGSFGNFTVEQNGFLQLGGASLGTVSPTAAPGTALVLSTAGPSYIGIDTGATDIMAAYTKNNGVYFGDAGSTDFAYRNTHGALLLGNNGSHSALRINNNTVQIGGASGTPITLEQRKVITASPVCSAAANGSCTFSVTFPNPFQDTNWSIMCQAQNATGPGAIYGGGGPTTTTAVVGFHDLSGASNSLLQVACTAWE